MPYEVWDEITYPNSDFNGCAVEVWEWIRNFIPHYIMDVIAHPCWVSLYGNVFFLMCFSVQGATNTEIWRFSPVTSLTIVTSWYGNLYPHCRPFVRRAVDYPHRGTVMQSSVGFFVVSLSKLLRKQPSCWWFGMSWRSCDVIILR